MFVTIGNKLWTGSKIHALARIPIDPSNPDVTPMIVHGRTMLPLRFIADNLGCTTAWDGSTQTVTINYT